MKLLVLVKEIVDTDAVDVEKDEYLTKEFDSDDIIMSSFDKHAIEAALTLQEQHEGTSVHALCLGSENALKVLREAIAMGIDNATRVDAEEIDYISAYAKGKILSKAISHLGSFDLILTGMYSTDFGQAQLATLLAANLNLPQITYLNTLQVENKVLIGDRYVEAGSVKVKMIMPGIVSIASTANEPRYTSVKRILKAKKTEIPVLSMNDIGIDEDSITGMAGLELVAIEEPDIEVTEVFKVEDSDLDKGVDTLLNKLKEENIDLGGFK